MPNCIRSGFGDFKCLRCDKANNNVSIPALGHDWGDATHTDATCTTASYDEHTCNRCGATERYNEVAALGHIYGEDHICTRCSEDYGTISYIGTNGQTASCSDYKFIVSSGNVTLGNSSYDGWYAVYGDVSLTKLKFLDKTVNLILLDGAKLTIETTTQTDGIEVDKPMNIYGQLGSRGQLVINAGNAGIYAMKALGIYGGTVTSTGRASNGIQANGNLTIAGGTVSGTSTLNGNGIYSMGTLSVTGGNVTATGGTDKKGMYGYNGINLSWANTATSITSSSYGGSVTLAKSFLGSDGNVYVGTIADASVLNDVTLTGADILYDTADNDISGFAATTSVSLYGRTLYRDGDWNTLCLPFSLASLTGTPLEGFTVMELDGSASYLDGDGTLYLNFKASDGIEAGKPYIVKKLQTSEDVTSPGLSYTGGTYSETSLCPANYLLDGDKRSYWIGKKGNYCDFQTGTPVYVTGYTLTTGYIDSYINPTEWTLYAKKNAGDGWTAIDSRNANSNGNDALPNSSYAAKGYNVQNPGLYQYFHFVASDDYFALAELSLQGHVPTPDSHLTNPLFTGITVSNASPTPVESSDGAVRFVGSYSPVSLDANDKSVLYLGAANTLYYPNADMTLGSCRALFRLNGASAQVRDINLNFDEQGTQTKIGHTEITEITERANAWYTINGVKLEGKPTQKGLYIYGNKKVVIK
ncbi:hypothetical protein [uncultured Prevotella sp.]|uniref:hypothetical protein n=1 Tax=uncultured Prevotella sp. TaxID=159272 RepID=UPI0025F78AD6|nr:hypothetical protein [uncultured Prevotella sp.]